MAEIKVFGKPTHLYRYRSLGSKIDQEIDAILNRYIYCPDYTSMNDPMEGSFEDGRVISMISNRIENRDLVAIEIRNTGIASFSETNNHETMWAHYADKFKGICIQYNLNSLLKGLDEDIDFARMMYSENAPALNNDRSTITEKARNCLSSKTIRWSSEREWRIFSSTVGKAFFNKEQPVRKIFLGAKVSKEDEKKF